LDFYFDQQVYLAVEEKELDGKSKANTLIADFGHKFRSCRVTVHPTGLPDEAQGKGSNVRWAAKQASAHYKRLQTSESVIVTVMDGMLCCATSLINS
jgi:hypothetical protein